MKLLLLALLVSCGSEYEPEPAPYYSYYRYNDAYDLNVEEEYSNGDYEDEGDGYYLIPPDDYQEQCKRPEDSDAVVLLFFARRKL
jgi:hypothetical protein